MDDNDKSHIDAIVELIASKSQDESVVARAYAYLKETRGESVAKQLFLLRSLYKGRHKIDASEVETKIREVFAYEHVVEAVESQAVKIASFGIPLFALFLVALVLASAFGYEPKGFGVVAFSMLGGLAATLIYWHDDGIAEFTGKVGGGKFKVVGAAAVFLVGFAIVVGVLKFTISEEVDTSAVPVSVPTED